MSLNIRQVDLVVIGAGPAGLVAAAAARRAGVSKVLLLERAATTGGILNQCIHDGFGLIRYGEALTGPEYARRCALEAEQSGVEIMTGAMVLQLTAGKQMQVVSRQGLFWLQAGAVILATGCRERSRGALGLPGSRPAGVLTAGVAQHYVNVQNLMPGRKILILGSGDIGLIMARRFTLEGAEVMGVIEKLPYPGGLQRNVSQCLRDFSIPLLLSHTITGISGQGRLQKAAVTGVDAAGQVIPDSTVNFTIDTLILSVGLIPENELARGAGVKLHPLTGGPVVTQELSTSLPGIFACGNTLHVHDLVDHASTEAEHAATAAAAYLAGIKPPDASLPVHAGQGVRYVLPFSVRPGTKPLLSLRVSEPARQRRVLVKGGNETLFSRSLPGCLPAEMLRLQLNEPIPFGTPALEVSISD